ncbi:sigma-70 family RNA polymerase sigma factor [Hymenobacter sp. DH14]|uniref:Sigma-70 family RNA polymerase sigma factor n=1 Tax=Hymenobacter cyanobacteriorum TaxID=2926463 RepID=A0A9X1VFU0_9BACT|nr:sigma-70 family RNA polymerase sigma factor [Hymenobacter cyanobacteriorum]MCI1188369.1 sigma-70 family RNA polymerase sigma factor [Hymenobacter cyanobacteriorum]
MTTSLLSAPPATTLRQALLADRARALTQLYRQAFPAVRRLVQRQGGSAQDAQDVFQDALVVFYEQAVLGTLELTASASTYLVSIARHRWQHELRRRARLPNEALPDESDALAAEEPEAAEETAFAVRDYVERLGVKCRDMLLNFYYFQQPLTQIAEANGYRSVRSATVQKFKCLERLRASVRAAFCTETIEY